MTTFPLKKSSALSILIACAVLWPVALFGAPETMANLREKLTVVAGAQDLKLTAGKAQLVQPEDGPAYAELMEHRGLSWKWPQDRFVPGVEYTLEVEFSHVGSLAKIPCNGLSFSIWNEAYRLYKNGEADQAGNPVNLDLDRARLRAIGTKTALVEVGTFQPAAVAGTASVDFQKFVSQALRDAGGDFPRVYRFIFTPQLGGETPEELRKMAEQQ